MSEYQKQAIDFLKSCNATMDITFIGTEINPCWNEDQPRNKYHFVITTPKGKMEGDFWDSLYNTEIYNMTVADFLKKTYRILYARDATKSEREKARSALAELQKQAKHNEYHILACLEKYDVGSIDDFMDEFGYEINSTRDFTNLLNTYNAVVKQYNDLCRIFTEEQMEMLRKIQ